MNQRRQFLRIPARTGRIHFHESERRGERNESFQECRAVFIRKGSVDEIEFLAGINLFQS